MKNAIKEGETVSRRLIILAMTAFSWQLFSAIAIYFILKVVETTAQDIYFDLLFYSSLTLPSAVIGLILHKLGSQQSERENQ